jgi:hypothetical protein
VVLDVGVKRVAQRGSIERCDCTIPILGSERFLATSALRLLNRSL